MEGPLMARIASTVADLIGNTPLVRINHVAGDGVDVVAKVEAFNPASSVKDRIARSIIDAAEASGALAPGGTIVEATSGNTGIALSMVGAARGYKVVIVMPASMSVERRAIVRAFGAELVLTDPKGGVSAAVAEAELRARGAAVLDTIWNADVTLRIAIDPSDRDSIDACLAQASSGVAKFRYVETRRVELDEAPTAG